MKKLDNAVFYQIWPRSFYDSNNDGIGDIQGIIQKLDYIKSLNVDYIWLSPVYQSPNDDYGYDVSNYFDIHPDFGNLDDMKLLIHEADKRELKIIMDLVANHTSTSHPWFIEALKDKHSPKRNYYFFKEGKDNGPPNNWISIFGGSAWTKMADNEYVLTLFTPTQADLNWENPEVRKSIVDIMEFWLKHKVAGFRLDVINTISKKPGLPSKNPHKKGYQFADDYIINRDESVAYVKEIMNEINKKYNCVTVGEGMLMTQQAARMYANQQDNTLDMMFHFDLHMLGCGPLGKFDFRKLYHWTILDFKKIIASWQQDSQDHQYGIGNYLSNHDQPRQVSRFGNDKKYHQESAKALALLNLTLRGTPFIYQGEEIGMTNTKLEKEMWKDFEAKNAYQVLQDMMHLPAFLAKKIIQKMSRDHSRTPMQWNNHEYAGFSLTKPWFDVNPNYQHINVKQQDQNPNSILNFYRQLTTLFKNNPALNQGDYQQEYSKHKQVIGYLRRYENQELLVLINLSKYVATINLNQQHANGKIVISTYLNQPMLTKKMIMRPYEGILVEVINES